MAIDMNVDLGQVFKDLFAKGKGGASNGKGSGPSDPFIKVAIAGGVALLLIVLYLFLVYFPTQAENRIKEQKISQINDLNSCLVELSDNISSARKNLSAAQAKYKKLTNLFHTGQELDDLYRHISMLALSNQLMVSKIQKAGERPVFEIEQFSNIDNEAEESFSTDMDNTISICDNIQTDEAPIEGDAFNDDFQGQFSDDGSGDGQAQKPQKVAYYEFKVEFEISGDYASYTNFRKGLAKLEKIININQEKIIVLQSETKKGQVKVSTILAIYRLPANESEKFVTNSQEEF
jgi:Tfp pilus assembly protein PilO